MTPFIASVSLAFKSMFLVLTIGVHPVKSNGSPFGAFHVNVIGCQTHPRQITGKSNRLGFMASVLPPISQGKIQNPL